MAHAELESAEDWEKAAKSVLSEASWEYISGGEADTIQRNRAAFARWAFRPRVLRDVSSISLDCEAFGRRCAAPLYLSSLAKGRLVSPDGEACFVRAARRLDVAFLAPMVSSLPLEQIAAQGEGLVFQLYLFTDEEESFAALARAIELKASAVVITVDANAPRKGSFHRATTQATGVFPSPKLDWRKLLELRRRMPSDLPWYLKGVQCAEDALQAAAVGVTGIIVSNHGGRACGDAIGSLEALEEVCCALRRAGLEVEVYFDSGLRSGRDVLKALCLGARAVGLGRPYYWAAAVDGDRGIVALVEMLSAELHHAMAQIGAPSLKALGPHFLRPVPAVPAPAL
ncbi:unnamed protein product [Effrenium voratum]|nr:unnamed protein product [Effrenium voratum]